MDDLSREFGKLESRVDQLERESEKHFETRKDYYKWKNVLLGIAIVIGHLIPITMWFVGKYF